MHYHLIVHRDDVYMTKHDRGVSPEFRERAHEVASTIDHLIENMAEEIVLEIPKGRDPCAIPPCVEEGDSVTLYGAFHGSCLSGTQMSLMLKGIESEYHPDGFL